MIRVIVLGLLCLPVLRAADTAASESSNFEKTREQIDALFRKRDGPLILPATLRNPFSRPNERTSAGSDALGVIDPSQGGVLSNRDLLERVAPAIQVRGILETGGHPAIIIGKKPFDEGDTLTITYGATTLEVKITRITNDTFTLAYKDAELTLRLPR
ncbi:MAG: hypothetical protein PHE83_07720 [Opitutaceae bacterium]|nr:hypothetical protein [Opitutaceae bacterium]